MIRVYDEKGIVLGKNEADVFTRFGIMILHWKADCLKIELGDLLKNRFLKIFLWVCFTKIRNKLV